MPILRKVLSYCCSVLSSFFYVALHFMLYYFMQLLHILLQHVVRCLCTSVFFSYFNVVVLLFLLVLTLLWLLLM